MPVYNEEKHLASCLDSIVQQSFQDWELIAINDFSSDQSESILKKYQEQDARIRYFNNQKKGIISALELAYKHCSAEAITRMDADDIMTEDKLECLQQALIKNPKACITAFVEYFSDTVLQDGFTRYAGWLNQLVQNRSHYLDIYKECVVASPCWMMHRSTIEQIGGIVSDRYPEDYDLCFRLYAHRVPIIGVEKTLHLWRDHPNRASRNDSNYADQAFIPLKLYHFLDIDFKKEKKLKLLGAGTSGKRWAKALIEKNISFEWLSNNPKKIGHNIYGLIVQADTQIPMTQDAQILVAIKDQQFNLEKLKQKSHESVEYFALY